MQKQTQIIEFLKKTEDKQNLDATEESSKNEDILQHRKFSHLAILSSDEEEKIKERTFSDIYSSQFVRLFNYLFLDNSLV